MNNKIGKAGIKPAFLTGIFLAVSCWLSAQQLPVSPYGLPFINSVSFYRESLINHPEKQMVSLSDIPGIILDLRYASHNNFMLRNLYPENTITTFLRKPVYRALKRVARDLAGQGLVLVIFDAYRPYGVTEELWRTVPDERYAANPAKGSGHNRGIAVDLTMADAKTQQRVPMPTGFDNFSDTANQDFMGLDTKQLANRELLKKEMKKYGFIPLSTEWWHFSWPNPENFEVLDLDFEELSRLQTK
ncbi:MAG TPA: peptidase M15 [Chitinophagaceae bacterium]|jgi:zinc D-Ala-D-Ala dipeptidase|nr:peptidase M15 [Chitinophagaceae bacterium]